MPVTKRINIGNNGWVLACLCGGVLLCALTVFWMLDSLPVYVLLHAGLMLCAWSVCFPIGVLIARFFKVTHAQKFPEQLDNQYWWIWHQILQYLGILLATVATLINWQHGGFGSTLHAKLGLLLVVLAWAQAVSSWLRGTKGGPSDVNLKGDHFDMTLRRKVFEHWHKSLGWLCLLTSQWVLGLGLQLVGVAFWVCITVPTLNVAFFCLVFWRLSKQKRWITTYEAIWGVPAPHGPLITQFKSVRK